MLALKGSLDSQVRGSKVDITFQVSPLRDRGTLCSVMRPETVLVGDVTVVVVPDNGEAIEQALSTAAPGSMVILATPQPWRALRELARYGGVVIDLRGQAVRPESGVLSPD